MTAASDDDTEYARRDADFLAADKARLKRTRNLRLIPAAAQRIGGKSSYAEWAWVIGLFQSLLCQHLPRSADNRVLDAGCGTGLLGIAAEPYVQDGGEYLGLEVRRPLVEACRRHFTEAWFRFEHLETHNGLYAPNAPSRVVWPVADADRDMVTALSVWTHLLPEDAYFYFDEIARVLKPGGRAIVTLLLLDAAYRNNILAQPPAENRFNHTRTGVWRLEKACEDPEWFVRDWAKEPEIAVGVTEAGLQKLLDRSGLIHVDTLPGHWKNTPGLFFQDIVIVEKPV